MSTTSVPGTPSLLRAINDRAALEALLARGPLTRPQVSDLTGISKPTASQLLARLEQAGLVVRDGIREDCPGAPPSCTGSTAPPPTSRAPTSRPPGSGSASPTWPGRSSASTPWPPRAHRRGRRRPDGRGARRRRRGGRAGPRRPRPRGHRHPGRRRPRHRAARYAAHIPGWHIPDLVDTLSGGLGVPVAIENDVNLAALAEQAAARRRLQPWHHRRKAPATSCCCGSRTGVGMAVVLNGVLHRGATGGACEIGYMPAVGAPLMRDVRRTHTGGVHSLTGGSAVLKLMREHGFRGRRRHRPRPRRRRRGDHRTAHPHRRGRPRGTRPHRTGVAARRHAGHRRGRHRPALVVLTGDVLRAAGTARARVEQHLHSLTIPRPKVRLSTVEATPS